MKMRKKAMAAMLTAAFFSLGLTGCAENKIPDMTDAQIQVVGEYVAVKLMKYDAGHRSRLMDLSEYGDLIWDQEWPEGQDSNAPEEGMKPTEDTPVIDSAAAETAKPINSLEEVLEFPEGVTVQFTGEKICAYYPEDDGSPYFSLNATEGKKLLVLSFSVLNATEQEQALDLLPLEAGFTINVNGDYTRRALTTLMENDFATYRETLPAGESREVVLVIEIEEEMAENIFSISLSVKNSTSTYSAQLL